MRRFASVVLLSALVAQAAIAQPHKKQVKDQAEQDLYNQAVNAEDPARQIKALDLWSQKYPESDFKDDRLYLYMQAYYNLDPPQPAKVIEYGARLMARNLRALFNTPEGGLVTLNVLFLVAWNVASVPAPTPEQLTLGNQAARDLLDFAPQYFIPEHKPPDTTEAGWAAAHADIEKRTQAARIAMALAPGNQAMTKNPPDCAAAATAWSKALADYPENALIAYSLGRALHCEGRTPQAIYQFVRAAELDPSLGGSTDPKQIADYAARVYASYHGAEDGLDRLKNQVKNAPLPPEDFSLETAAEAATREQNEFARNNPQVALWMAIRRQLETPNGLQYFEGQLKNTLVSGTNGARALKGTVVEGRPACRPRELLVAVAGAPRPEIAIRLDSPLAGTAVAGEIEFDAVPRLFVREPLMLTVDADRTKITNLMIGPCPPR